MSKRKKKMTVKQLRSLVAFLITINIILVICILVLGFFLARARSTNGDTSIMLKRANDSYTVCVDAGHGGSDVGAVGLDGSYEKDDNLRIALKVAEALRQSGVNVIMPRDDDSDTKLDSRSKICITSSKFHCKAKYHQGYRDMDPQFRIRAQLCSRRRHIEQSGQGGYHSKPRCPYRNPGRQR